MSALPRMWGRSGHSNAPTPTYHHLLLRRVFELVLGRVPVLPIHSHTGAAAAASVPQRAGCARFLLPCGGPRTQRLPPKQRSPGFGVETLRPFVFKWDVEL